MATGINLISWKKEFRFRSVYYFWVKLLLFLGIALLILLWWHVILKQKIGQATKQIDSLHQQQNLIIAEKRDDIEIRQHQELIQQIIGTLAALKRAQVELGKIFAALHQGVAKTTYLAQLIIKNHEVKVVGKTRSISDLMQLVTRFSQVKEGSSISIQKISRQNDSYDFTLLWSCRGI